MVSNECEIKVSRVTRKILLYSLIWPKEGEEINPGKWYYIRIFTFLSFTSLWCIAICMHFIIVLKDKINWDVTEETAIIIAIYGTYYMVLAYVRNQKKAARILRDLSNFEKFGVPPGFEEEERRLKNYIIVVFIHAFITITFYNFYKLSQKNACERFNEEHDLHENCGLLSPVWIPFKVDHFPQFQLVFLYLFTCCHLLMKLPLIVSYNALEMVHHIILRINHLKIMLTTCFDEPDYHICRRKLRQCILYHIEILEFATRVDDCFSNCMFAHLTLTGAICACLEKQIVSGISTFGAILHFIGWILALFIGCLGGQHFINASDTIPESIWASKWYNVDVRLRRDLILMMMRSQRDLNITAGPFGVVSYALFVSVLKMSYSILCVLT
ncbi:odorant receptor 49b-like [Tribolium madens]|uniref:odorant receptor 49b-like n=1 Tax=Tribolium madens TaxID=41895 RepID=UPI001CF71EB7|nr:odorant receptor 49b-like [Tribolium madens]